MSSGAEAHLFTGTLPTSQTGQRPLQLKSSIRAQKDVEEGVQQSVEAGQTVAQPVDKENWTLQAARLVGQQQRHESVSTHKVVGPEDRNEVDGDDDEDPYNFVAFVVRQRGRAAERHPYVGRGVAEGGSRELTC